jgi:sugar/nucleoside kinase (ribokinase family)
MTTSLDPGFDPSEQWDGDLMATLGEVDVFLPNEVELSGVGRCADVAQCLRKLDNGRTVTVAKLGAAGCVALEAGEVVRVAAFPADAVDSTEAGDSFNAGFLHAWLRGWPLANAMGFAAACGALSMRAMGGTDGQLRTRRPKP